MRFLKSEESKIEIREEEKSRLGAGSSNRTANRSGTITFYLLYII